MNSEALHFNDVTFGPRGRAAYGDFGRPFAELRIWEPNDIGPVHSFFSPQGGGIFLEGTLSKDDFPDAHWQKIVGKFSEKARASGIWACNESNKGEKWLHFAGVYPKHHAYLVLELFQEAIQEAGNQTNGPRFLLRRTGNSDATPVEPSDVGMNGHVDQYASRSEVREVFDALNETVTEREKSYGISHKLASWMEDALQSFEYALTTNCPFSPGPLKATNGTLGEAPQYFQNFHQAVERLSTSYKSAAPESWREQASAALTDLETGLSTFASHRHS